MEYDAFQKLQCYCYSFAVAVAAVAAAVVVVVAAAVVAVERPISSHSPQTSIFASTPCCPCDKLWPAEGTSLG